VDTSGENEDEEEEEEEEEVTAVKSDRDVFSSYDDVDEETFASPGWPFAVGVARLIAVSIHIFKATVMETATPAASAASASSSPASTASLFIF